MTAEIINLAEYKAKKQRREAFDSLREAIIEKDGQVFFTKEPIWVAFDFGCDSKPKDKEDK